MTSADEAQQQPPRPVGTPHLTTIDRSECELLLGQHQVGRIGWNAPAGPQILPVNYALSAGRIVLRTAPDTPLARLARRSRVAFEVDRIDEEHQTGWSVVVVGSTEHVTRPQTLSTLWADGPQPWAEGARTVFIAIIPDSITGRRVRGPFVP